MKDVDCAISAHSYVAQGSQYASTIIRHLNASSSITVPVSTAPQCRENHVMALSVVTPPVDGVTFGGGGGR